MGKVLHLIPDEKVTDNVIENFEKVFSDNIFFVLGDKDKRKYCKSVGNNIIFGNKEFFVKENIPSDVKGIVIHGLNHIFAKMILNISTKIKIGWFAWGYDIYFLPKISGSLYSKFTYKYLSSRNRRFKIVNKIKNNKFLRFLYYVGLKGGEDYYSIYEKAHKRVDFFCTYVQEDYILFRSKYNFTASFENVGYFSVKQYLSGQENLRVTESAKNILIGNSNSPECNHLDVLDILDNNRSYFDGDLVVPLNYGEDSSYKVKVLLTGQSMFFDRFVPLLEFMDRLEYFTLLRNCSTAIFYHNRQQAMGNIIAFLYMGGRVYLSTKNPVYSYFKRIGIQVFDLDSDFIIYGVSRLDEDLANSNRSILEKYFDDSIIYEQNKNLIEKLINVNR